MSPEIEKLENLQDDDNVIFTCDMCEEEFALTKKEIADGADTDICENCQSKLLEENSEEYDEDEEDEEEEEEDDEDEVNVLDDYDDLYDNERKREDY